MNNLSHTVTSMHLQSKLRAPHLNEVHLDEKVCQKSSPSPPPDRVRLPAEDC